VKHPIRNGEARIATALDKWASTVEHNGPGHWSFSLSNGTDFSGHLRLEDDWLAVDVPLRRRQARRSPWGLLRLNAELPELTKLVRRPGRTAPVLVSELLLHGDADLTTRLGDAFRGLAKAVARLEGEHGSTDEEPAVQGEGHAYDLERLCGEIGWPCRKPDDGTIVIDLDSELLEEGSDDRRQFLGRGIVGGAPPRLHVREDPRGVRVWLTLARVGPLPVQSRKAIGMLLLRAGGSIRQARATLEKTEGGSALIFEAVLPHAPSARQIDHALSAVCIAASRCGPEVGALQHGALATRYLGMTRIT
jgi:hypothetical protein